MTIPGREAVAAQAAADELQLVELQLVELQLVELQLVKLQLVELQSVKSHRGCLEQPAVAFAYIHTSSGRSPPSQTNATLKKSLGL